MKISHVNVTMPKGSEDVARAFYGGLLDLKEIPKPEVLRVRGGVWFDVGGGLQLHLSVEDQRLGPDGVRHFGLECVELDKLHAKLTAAGFVTEAGRPVPWKRFLVLDPFGNRIEIHEPGGLQG